jgi:hypothetical protein
VLPEPGLHSLHSQLSLWATTQTIHEQTKRLSHPFTIPLAKQGCSTPLLTDLNWSTFHHRYRNSVTRCFKSGTKSFQ